MGGLLLFAMFHTTASRHMTGRIAAFFGEGKYYEGKNVGFYIRNQPPQFHA